MVESQNTKAVKQTNQETAVMNETEPSDRLTKEQREQLEAYGYWIYEDSYALTDSYRFSCIQVEGMSDKGIQNKVNDSLKQYFQLTASLLAAYTRKTDAINDEVIYQAHQESDI